MEKKVIFTTESTLTQQCYEQLQSDIIEGRLKPGEKLKVEPIKQRFSIGQSPIREALSRLVSVGLVEVEDNKGFRVAAVSEADVRDTYAIYTLIETSALRMAIERSDALSEALIVAELYKLSLVETDKPVSYAIWGERNYAFHYALIAGCKSPILLEIRKKIYAKFDRYCRIAFGMRQDTLVVNHTEHAELAEAVLKKDAKRAIQLMTYHINDALEDVIKKLKEQELL